MSTGLKPFLPVIRLFSVLITLIFILYFAIYLGLFFPYEDSHQFGWRPDNVYTVTAVSHTELEPGDIVLAIDDRPARQSFWQPLYTPHQSAYQLTVQRAEQVLDVTVSPHSPTIRDVLNQIKTGVVALLVWGVAVPIVLYAKQNNRVAWYVGTYFLVLAVDVAASEARLLNVPGALLMFPLGPLLGVAFAQLAFLPASLSKQSQKVGVVFRWLYLGAVVLAFVSFVEILYLFPRGSSFERITGVSLYAIVTLFQAAGLLANPLILIWRFFSTSSAKSRRHILILLTFTSLAIFPIVFLAVLPGIVFQNAVLTPFVATMLLAFIPAGYGFVIYRRNYLELELIATRTLTILILTIVITVLYLAAFLIFNNWLRLLTPLPGLIPFLIVIIALPILSRPVHHTVESLIFGAHIPYQKYIDRITSELSANPQQTTLQSVVIEVANLVEVRRALLLIRDHHNQLVTVAKVLAPDLPPIPAAHCAGLDNKPFVRERWSEAPTHLPITWPEWVALIMPLVTDGTTVGFLLLGEPVPEGYFNAQQMRFVRQVAEVIVVVSELIRLFDSSLEISRSLRQAQDRERAQLASRIHDEPLQRLTIITNSLTKLVMSQDCINGDLIDDLESQKKNLKIVAQQLRDICAGIRPPILKQGIPWIVREVVYDFEKTFRMEIKLQLQIPDSLKLDEQATMAAYHVLVEALNNSLKHAQATEIMVTVTEEQNQFDLYVADNGHGNAFKSLSLSDLIRQHHFGIVGMYEWASLAKGELSIQNDGGTTVHLKIPLSYTTP